MMILLSIIALIASSSISWGFKYEDCGKKGTSIIKIESLRVSPSTIKVPGDVTGSANVTLLKDIPEDAKLEMRVVRKLKLGWFEQDIPIPCLGDTGSCTKNICKFVEENEDRLCPFMPDGIDCKCPFKAGVYESQEVLVPMPDFGSLLNLIISGDYTFRFRVLHENKELVCVKFWLSLSPAI